MAAVPVLAVLAAVAVLCLSRATDAGLFTHLETGRLIRATGDVPRSDPFSYTAYGLPWVDPAWLFQVGASRLFELGGPASLTIAGAGLVTGLFAFLLFRGRRAMAGLPWAAPGPGPAVAAAGAAAVLLAAVAAHERFIPGPQVLSWWLLALVLAGLEAALFAEGAVRRRLVLWAGLPVAVLVWANVDVSFILGPAMTLLALVAAGAGALLRAIGKRRRPGPGVAAAADLLVSLALQAGAALVNPHGARAVRLPFERFLERLESPALPEVTLPGHGPTLSGDLATPAVAAFALLAAATAAAMALNRGRTRLFEILVTGATLYLGLVARDDLAIFAIAAAPILLRNAAEVLSESRAKAAWARPSAGGDPIPAPARRAGLAAPAIVAVAALVLAAGTISNRFLNLAPAPRWFGAGAIPYFFPDEAAAFVRDAALAGQVFHPLATGGFLIAAWKGEHRVFIDGRPGPYRHGVQQAYLRAVADPEAFEAAARKYQITTVLWPHQQAREGAAILAWLAGGHGWVLVHLDPAAAVYAREEVIAPESPIASALPGSRPPAEMHTFMRQRLASRPFDGPPIREIALAGFFEATGDAAGAEIFRRAARAGGAGVVTPGR